jgi:uncharacterized protein YchJ
MGNKPTFRNTRIRCQGNRRSFHKIPTAGKHRHRGTMRNLDRKQTIEGRASSERLKADPEPARNEPCPCGSGKKYKKCCRLKKEAE